MPDRLCARDSRNHSLTGGGHSLEERILPEQFGY
jgi:hypothetical protein